MGGMPMSGGWTMSTVWMRMPGDTSPGAAAAFVPMWDLMMVAMMLPSLMPVLLRYRRNLRHAGEMHIDGLTVRVGVGYFIMWSIFGAVVNVLEVGLGVLESRVPTLTSAVPLATGVIVLLAGVFQLSPLKAHYLACCRKAQRGDDPVSAIGSTSLRYGLRLGLHCICSCAGLTSILLVAGLMDLRAMALVTAAISLERLARNGERAAQGFGAVSISAGLFLVARAAGAG